MSSPLSGSASGSPAPGFYPDPSIPGYIRYWNGSAWVPGTSRPEPREGDPMPSPPSAAAASSAISAGPPPSRAEPAPVEETGPVFLDEDSDAEEDDLLPGDRIGGSLPEVRPRGEVATTGDLDWDDPGRLHGRRPEPASAWQADASRQSGFAGQSDERVSWGQAGESAGGGDEPAADPRGGWGRRTDEGPADSVPAGPAAPALPEAPASAGAPDPVQPPPREGTVQMRAVNPEASRQSAQAPEHTVGLRRSDVLNYRSGARTPASEPPAVPGQGVPGQPQSPGLAQPGPSPAHTPPAQRGPVQSPPVQTPPAQAPPAHGGFGGPVAPQQSPQPSAQGPQAPAQAQPGVPQQDSAAYGQEGAQPSWAQQVHDLAAPHQPGPGAPGMPGPQGPGPGGLPAQPGGPDAVTPWRPPASDPFLQAAARQQVRPAGLGKRLGARLVDAVLTMAVAGAVAFPFAGQAADHIEQKTDAVKQAGRTEQVWLIDGTTGGYLALVLGVLFVFGLLYEVVPTQRWGRTLGKKMFGLKVLTMEQEERPRFGAALLRWLVYGVLSLLVIGVVNVLWCVFDRPWRQCWHDKLAGTFVSKDSGELRL